MAANETGLAIAARDYRWLLDRGYAGGSSLNLVGDRHRLEREERMILFRGVFASGASRRRAALISGDAAGRPLHVDGYNQALAVMHYLMGKRLFIGSDGLLRDAGASHGRVSRPDLFERAARLMAAEAARARPAAITVHLDAPVSSSASHAALFRAVFAETGIEAIVLLEKSADFALKSPCPGAVVASSDSAIADALADRITAANPPGAAAGVFDLARATLEGSFGPLGLLDLGRLLAEEAGESADA
jgi:hypothetical protein